MYPGIVTTSRYDFDPEEDADKFEEDLYSEDTGTDSSEAFPGEVRGGASWGGTSHPRTVTT